MIATESPTPVPEWRLWTKVLFRFFFIYLFFQLAPWNWLGRIPGPSYIVKWYGQLMDWAVDTANARVFHIAPVLVPINGSGDTSYGWAQLCLIISLAVIGCIIWSVIDRRRKNYSALNYWLCLFARYYIAMYAFAYGILKIFALQMIFPSLHQMATPLGDLLPMRLSWLFIGYSTPYQVFSGIAEVLAGLLLLYRRTATLGTLLALGVFTNVMMLNLSYDIPVKIFSIQLVLVCLFLLANEAGRIWDFFVLNKPAPGSSLYTFRYRQKWMRITRLVLKAAFIIIAVVLEVFNGMDYYKFVHKPSAAQVIPNGVYAVTNFSVTHHGSPLSLSDSLRWQDVIFEDGTGSIKTTDALFRQRYGRGYFAYSADDQSRQLAFKDRKTDSANILVFHYDLPDSNSLHLWGKKGNDSLDVELRRTNHHFPLAERQFHWLSEYNR
jgi:hypothetical protein